MNTTWLTDNGFAEFGVWAGPRQKLQRKMRIGRTPGVYAFVVDDLIVYFGKASHLRGRVRAYNRFLQSNDDRPHREAHKGLIEALAKSGQTVSVFVRQTATAAEARSYEKQWIERFDPIWNRADRRIRTVHSAT
jgi:excinuclease UvrABC nuclease subunit